jgi:hypothetical protein
MNIRTLYPYKHLRDTELADLEIDEITTDTSLLTELCPLKEYSAFMIQQTSNLGFNPWWVGVPLPIHILVLHVSRNWATNQKMSKE